MSTYQTIVGRIIFDDDTSFTAFRDKYAALLTDDGRFMSEVGGYIPTAEGKTDLAKDRLTVHIPKNTYRNFSPMFDELLDCAHDFGLVWFCSDGTLEGGYRTPHELQTIRRDELTVENGYPNEPTREEHTTQKQWAEAHTRWRHRIEDIFIRRYSQHIPPVPSIHYVETIRETAQTTLQDYSRDSSNDNKTP